MQLHPHDPSWAARFALERERLLAALGHLTEGGVLETIQHIGATSVPCLPARPTIDIGLSVWPLPLDARRQAALAALGYQPVPGYAGESEQRFRHQMGGFQLLLAEAGGERWASYPLLRDYLAHDEAARQRYAGRRQALAEVAADPASYEVASARLIEELLAPAERWWVAHVGFAALRAATQELAEAPHPWYVSSGWALDLYLGRVTRLHHDVDIVVARADQLKLQAHLTGRGWTLLHHVGGRFERWHAHMRLELPRQQAHAHRDGAFIDCLLAEIEGGVWRYRRNLSVLRSVERMSLVSPEGIPFLAPELALLFKSKNTSGKERGKDQVDFEAVRDALEPERRAWLRWALLFDSPDHPWIAALD